MRVQSPRRASPSADATGPEKQPRKPKRPSSSTGRTARPSDETLESFAGDVRSPLKAVDMRRWLWIYFGIGEP